MPRIDRLIARNVGLSRKQVTRLFRGGRIRDAEGSVLRDAGMNVAEAELPMSIRIDEHTETLRDRHSLLQHKPRGVVTALKDGRHPTAYSLVAEEPLHSELRAVGRLDLDCSGLLLWTTQGELVHKLAHPKYAVPREYHVSLNAPFGELPKPDDPPMVLEDGHQPEILGLRSLERDALHPALDVPKSATHFAEITLIGGRFHEVKRIFAALGSEVVGLARVAYGATRLPEDLEAGDSIALDLEEIFRDLSPRRKPGS